MNATARNVIQCHTRNAQPTAWYGIAAQAGRAATTTATTTMTKTMQITHNEVTALLWLVVFGSGGLIGGLIAWWRLSYRLDECCDCCACEDCDEEAMPFEALPGRIVDVPRPEPVQELRQPVSAGPGYWRPDATSPVSGRRTVVLAPGPTIYRALVPLDDESLYGPESRVKPSDSTFIRTVLMDWERRFPVPQDSPNGNM